MVNLRQFFRFIPYSFYNKNSSTPFTENQSEPEAIRSNDELMDHRKALLTALILVGISLLSLLILYEALHRDSNHMTSLAAMQNNRTQTILKALNDIHNEFQQLENSPQSSANMKAALSDINAHLDKIQSGLSSMQSDMDNKITDLQQTVNNNPNTRAYVDAKNLPFTIISVDVIAEQPFVSVNYENHVSPLGIGDTLAGWSLISADYDQSIALFKNDRDQYAQVAIKN